MCIIVAKNSGVKMPDEIILSNCFINNPDGAGIMVGCKGKVYGFKGLMTFDAFKAKLRQIEKNFGNLDKLPVVMHFRIKTHGATIAANTHPFPVASSYKTLRKLEWVSDYGVAHNGIITATATHPDVKKENVSDTMVFVKRVIYPIAAVHKFMDDEKVLEAISLASGSKLAFLDGKRLRVLGDFVYQNGVYYSNYSFEGIKYIKSFGGYYSYDWGDDYDYKWSKSSSKKDTKSVRTRLSNDDEKFLRESLAQEYGLIEIGNAEIICEEYAVPTNGITYAVDEMGRELYYWDENDYEWVESSFSDTFVDYIREGAYENEKVVE